MVGLIFLMIGLFAASYLAGRLIGEKILEKIDELRKR